MKDEKKYRIICLVGLLIIVALVIWAKIFHFDLSFSIRKQVAEGINYIPFVALFKRGPKDYIVIKYLTNIILYIPIGMCLSILLKKWYYVLSMCFILSVILETFQFFFSIGVADITAVILNSFGAMAGFVLLIFSKNREKKLTATIISVVLTIILVFIYVMLVILRGL